MSKYIWGAALCTVWSYGANAQVVTDIRDDVDEIIVASRINPLERRDLTSPISVLTKDDIQARSQSQVTDLLRSLPGLSVSNSGPGTGLSQIRLRGSEANQVLVLVDGIEVSNPTDGGFDFASLRADDIIRIEILRGEQSALWGADAVGGVINIITRSGETTPGGSASVEIGSRETVESQLSARLPIGSAILSVNGNAFRTDGYDISGLNGEKDSAASRALNLGLNNIALGGLTLSAKYGLTRLETDFDSDSPFDGRLDNTDDETTFTQHLARLDGRFDLVGFSNLVSLSYLNSETDTDGGFTSQSEGERTKLSLISEREFGAAHTLTFLAEGEREGYDISPSFAASPTSPDNDTAAVAADYRFEGNRLTVNSSVRQSFNDRFEDVATWRIGAGYGFGWDGRVRASVGTAVKNPTLVELFGFFPDSNFVGNPDLRPEESFGYSVGYDQALPNGALSIDYFRSELTDEIFTDFSGFPFLPRNRTTDSEREGVEIEGRYKIGRVNVRGSVTWLDATENGTEEIRRPEWSGSVSLDWQASNRLGLGVFVEYTGDQLDTDFAVFSPVTLDAFTLVSATARYDLTDQVHLTLRGDNLLDEDYQELVSYASPGRAVYAGLSLDF